MPARLAVRLSMYPMALCLRRAPPFLVANTGSLVPASPRSSAQTLTERSLKLLTPTIREPGAEIWASWNPRHRTDAIDKFLQPAC